MNKIYPKLITTLFLILFGALVLKYADAGSNTHHSSTNNTARSIKTPHWWIKES